MSLAGLGDFNVYYEEFGIGEPLVLINGIGADHSAWSRQTNVFSKHFRVIVFDNPGIGATTGPSGPYTSELLADVLASLLVHQDSGPAHVLGASMGGIVAQQLALRHPQLVRSLQLHSTWGSADCQLSAIFHSWKTYAEKVPQLELFRQIWLWVYTPRWYRENPQELAEFERLVIEKPSIQNSKGFCDQAEACISHNALDQLSTIAAPTLITGGDCDTLVPQRHAHELKRRIPDALLHIWPQMGHAPFWEIADDFNSLCVMFAKAHEGKAGNYLVERVP